MRVRPAFALAASLALGAACSGGASEPSPDTIGAPSGSDFPVIGEPGFVLYRDTYSQSVVALEPGGSREFVLPVEPGKFPIAVECGRDGRNQAVATVDFSAGTSTLSISLDGAFSEPIEFEGTIRGLSWAPDGQTIAMSRFETAASENRLSILDVATREVAPLRSEGLSPGPPRWSPDGTRLVFSAAGEGVSQLYLADVVAETLVKLTEGTRSAFSPDWSSDGLTLIFSKPEEGGLSQFFTIDADGGSERQITTSDSSKASPRWSADGGMIAFAGTLPIPQASRSPTRLHNLSVWLANADGTDERSITDLSLDASPLGWCVSGPWLEGGWV